MNILQSTALAVLLLTNITTSKNVGMGNGRNRKKVADPKADLIQGPIIFETSNNGRGQNRRVNPLFPIRTEPSEVTVKGACGGSLTEEGTFEPPLNYRDKYRNNLDCTWVLTAPFENMKIKINFDAFSVENSADCANDVLRIYDGSTTSANEIDFACGSRTTHINYPDRQYESSGPSMTLRFTTNESRNNVQGFIISFIFIGEVVDACGGSPAIITSPSVISHPAVGSSYRNQQLCGWLIQAPEFKYVKLTLTSLDIEYESDCAYDFLEVHDGDAPNAPGMGGRICGDLSDLDPSGRNSAVRTTTGRDMMLLFFSDESVTASGFKANIEFVDSPGNQICSIDTEELTGSGTLVFPQDGGSYVNYADCSWLISAPGQRVSIEFTSLSIENGDNCKYDFVRVYDGSAPDQGFSEVFCGSTPPPRIVSHKDSVFIVFRSDFSVTDLGFTIRYGPTTDPGTFNTPSGLPVYGCSEDLQEISVESGLVLHVPSDGTSQYSHNLNCQWSLNTPIGNPITASFVFLNLESSSYCSKDKLEFFDGADGSAASLGKFCGDFNPGTIKSSNNNLFVQFTTDGDTVANGFMIVIHAGFAAGPCGTPPISPSIGVDGGARIVGGSEAIAHSWPWQVSLTTTSGFHFCGGSVISNEFILTAAHCVNGDRPSSLLVVLGSHARNIEEVGEEVRQVSEIIVYPGYNGIQSAPDAALLRLATPVEFSETIHPVCLPEGTAVTSGKCVITGWGALYANGPSPTDLQQVEVPIVSYSQCTSALGNVESFEICAGDLINGGVDSCQGDSGGPLVCHIGGKFELHGLTSWGYGCADPGNPGVYTKVAAIKDWVLSYITA